MKGKKSDKMEHEYRHRRASGGGVEEGDDIDESTPSDVYAGKDSEVLKEAKERTGKFKKGGKVSAFERGEMAEGMKKRMAKKSGGCAEGGSAHERMDRAPRKGRASGGVLSTASSTSDRPGAKVSKITSGSEK